VSGLDACVSGLDAGANALGAHAIPAPVPVLVNFCLHNQNKHLFTAFAAFEVNAGFIVLFKLAFIRAP
jgi:hypothetical protein